VGLTLGGLAVRKIWRQAEEIYSAAGADDGGGPLRKVAVVAVIENPYAGRGFAPDLAELIDGSQEIGTYLGGLAADLVAAPIQSYGKGALVGVAGEQEHGNAVLTSVFGDAFRSAIGGGKAWISSATKVSAAGASLDVPLACKDEIWVRSHYDAVTVAVPDVPLPSEIAVCAVAANRGRINARLGGTSFDEAMRSLQARSA
jgi:hypothetical protein